MGPLEQAHVPERDRRGMRQAQGQARLDHQHPALKTAIPGDPRVTGQVTGSPEMLELSDLSSLGLPMCVQPFVMLFFMNSSEACHNDHGCVREVSLLQHVKTKGSPNQKGGEQGHMHEYEDTCLSTPGQCPSTAIPNLYPFYLQPLPLQPHPFLKLSPTCNIPPPAPILPFSVSPLHPSPYLYPPPLYFQPSLLAAISIRAYLAGWALEGFQREHTFLLQISTLWL